MTQTYTAKSIVLYRNGETRLSLGETVCKSIFNWFTLQHQILTNALTTNWFYLVYDVMASF